MSMRYVVLGQSGLKVSELCMGTMTFGERSGWGAPLHECRRILEAFRARGGNFIDTANRYTEGESEKIVGELIKGARDYWVVATKFTLSDRDENPNSSGNGRKNMVQSVEQSLRRLGTDYIDLYWIHAWDWTTPIEELMRGLDDLVRTGKVLHVGISDAPAWIVSHANAVAALRGLSRLVAIQIEYSLIERTVERELVPMANYYGLGVLAWAPLGGGVLTGKYTREGQHETQRELFNKMLGKLSEDALKVARAVDGVADELGKTSTQVALAWLRSRQGQVIPILGSRKLEQVEDCLDCLDVALPLEALGQLDEASRIPLGFPHDVLALPAINEMVYGQTRDRLVMSNPVLKLAGRER
jgi:aryl-alcohol dehydrogenase-like predicted oxidoreductase